MVDLVTAELGRVHQRIAGRFGRAEPRARVRQYVSELVAGLERKNRRTLAEHAGEVSPDGMQRLLRRADWDVDGVRDDVRGYLGSNAPLVGVGTLALEPVLANPPLLKASRSQPV
jgi:SRSO17 transposase